MDGKEQWTQKHKVMGQALISSEGVQGAHANDTTGNSKLVAPTLHTPQWVQTYTTGANAKSLYDNEGTI